MDATWGRAPEDTNTDNICLYQHALRPEWGLAIAIGHFSDRKTFLFESGECRTFMNEYAHLMPEVEPAEEDAAQALKYFEKHAARVAARATTATGATKKRATKRKAAASGAAKTKATKTKATKTKATKKAKRSE